MSSFHRASTVRPSLHYFFLVHLEVIIEDFLWLPLVWGRAEKLMSSHIELEDYNGLGRPLELVGDQNNYKK